MADHKRPDQKQRRRLTALLGNPLEYSAADKTLLLASITALVLIFGWVAMHGLHTYIYSHGEVTSRPGHHTAESHHEILSPAAEDGATAQEGEEAIPAGHALDDSGRHDLHAEGLSFIEISFLILAGLQLTIVALALWLRRRKPDGGFLPVLYAVVTSVSIVYIYELAGHSNDLATLLILYSQMLFAMLLFGGTLVIIIFGTWCLMTGSLYLGERLEVIPHLVDLIATHESQAEFLPIIQNSIIAFSWFLMAIVLLVTAYIISSWRSREAQVMEYAGVLKKMFGQYLSAQVMNSFLENPATLKLGGERRRVTIMMADLRGFSSMAEGLAPERVVEVVNSFCTVMIEVILKFGGTIIEIMGDALLVVFGAPQKLEHRAERAVACALTMQEAMAVVNSRNREKTLPELQMGIGLNDADVIVGNIGSVKRSKYGVVGPGVNMASRIESFTVGGQVLISESLYRRVGNLLRIDGQKQFQPKGSEHAVTVYEVGGIAGEYNIAMKSREQKLLGLSQAIPLHYAIIANKRVGFERESCDLIRLGESAAEVSVDRPIEAMTNLMLNLADVDPSLATKNFYAKIIRQTGDGTQRYLIRFTSLPAEVAAFFQAVRKLGVASPPS